MLAPQVWDPDSWIDPLHFIMVWFGRNMNYDQGQGWIQLWLLFMVVVIYVYIIAYTYIITFVHIVTRCLYLYLYLYLYIYIHTVKSDVTQLNQLSSTTTYNNLIWLNEFTSLKYPVPGFAGTFSLMQCQASPWIFFGALMCKISPLQLWRESYIGNRFAFARLRGLWSFLDLNSTGL